MTWSEEFGARDGQLYTAGRVLICEWMRREYTQQMSHDKNMGWVWMGHSSDGQNLSKFQSS